ncbi:MAG: radical SAM protein [Promethearchaeia archaeon]
MRKGKNLKNSNSQSQKQKILFGLIYPNKISVGMSSYSIRLLYHFLNEFPFLQCERIFLPDHITFPASRDYSPLKKLHSQEHSIFPLKFDILGFSVPYENDFRNILWFLEKLEIPLEREKRQHIKNQTGKSYPLLIAGGPAITSNPLPLTQIIDMFFIGDAEPIAKDFFSLFAKYRGHGNYELFIEQVSKLQGIYISELNNQTQRQVLKDLNTSKVPRSQIIKSRRSSGTIFEKSFLLEVNRGCPFRCNFCISSFHNYPFRNRSLTQIKHIIDSIKENPHIEKISLIGSCVTGHPHFHDICQYILEAGMQFSIPSIRVEHLTQELISLLGQANVKTVTIAPEAGSERLRFKLGKKIKDDLIFSTLKQIKNSQIRNVKFYFLIGLPNENLEDVRKIVQFIKEIDTFGFKRNALRVSINPFVPKLNTPFQSYTDWYLSKNLSSFVEKYSILQDGLENLTSVKTKFSKAKKIIKQARLQTLFSLGDRHVSRILTKYYTYGANFGSLRRVLNENQFSIDEYLLKIKSGYIPWKLEYPNNPNL